MHCAYFPRWGFIHCVHSFYTSSCAQFPGEESYDTVQPKLAAMTREEVVSMLKRNSTGFSRGRSRFRGVTRALLL